MVFRVTMAAVLLVVCLRRLKQGPIQLGRPRYPLLVVALLLFDILLVTIAPPGAEFFGVEVTVLVLAVWGRDLLKDDLNVSSRAVGLAALAGFLLALPLIVVVLALDVPIVWPGLLTLIVVGGFNSIYEELLYRRLFIPLLQGWFGPMAAITVSAVVFAMSHIPEQIRQGVFTLTFLLFAFLYGILSGTIMVRTGSVVPSAVMHVVYNLLVEWLGR